MSSKARRDSNVLPFSHPFFIKKTLDSLIRIESIASTDIPVPCVCWFIDRTDNHHIAMSYMSATVCACSTLYILKDFKRGEKDCLHVCGGPNKSHSPVVRHRDGPAQPWKAIMGCHDDGLWACERVVTVAHSRGHLQMGDRCLHTRERRRGDEIGSLTSPLFWRIDVLFNNAAGTIQLCRCHVRFRNL